MWDIDTYLHICWHGGDISIFGKGSTLHTLNNVMGEKGSKCVDHDRLATLHLEYVNCPMFQDINLNGKCKKKYNFYMGIKTSHYYKNEHL